MKTDLNDLVIFVNVVEEGGFTAAASKLGLPKSTVSRKVAQLEDRLGVRLLQRSTRQLTITESGQRLFEHGTRIRDELEAAEQAVLQLNDNPKGLLNITVPVELGPFIMPMIAEFCSRYVEVEVNLDLTNRYVDLIAEGYHLAIRAGELSGSGLLARKLRTGGGGLVASPGYFKRYGYPQRVADLSGYPFVMFPKFSKRKVLQLLENGQLLEVSVQGFFGCNNLDACKHAVLQGLGMAQLPAEFCQAELEDGTMEQVFPDALPQRGNLWVVYPENRYPAPKVKTFVDALVAYYKQNPNGLAERKL